VDLFDAIQERHSYRGTFNDRPVPRELLKQIVEAGILAPSGCNAQTTSFVVIDDPDTLKAIADIMDRPVVRTAAAIILCIADPRAVYHGMNFGVEDCAAAVENMLLAITAFGLATVWIDGALRIEERGQRIAERTGIPTGHDLRVLLPVGYPAETAKRTGRLSFEERAHFNHWGQP